MDSSNYSGHSFVFFVGNRKSHGLPPQRRLGDKESLSPRVEIKEKLRPYQALHICMVEFDANKLKQYTLFFVVCIN